MNNLSFTLPEVISLIGVFQCVYILVYVGFRAGNFVRVILPVIYFFVLAIAFFIDLARSYVADITPYYEVLSWGAWTFTIPLSVLLIVQMSHIHKLPSLLNWTILLLVPAAFLISLFAVRYGGSTCEIDVLCPEFNEWLSVSGIIAGAISLLAIWGHRNLFTDILKQKAGKERYWLVLSLVIVNIAFLALTAFHTTGYDIRVDIELLRSVLGLGFVYLVSTSLFRIYPQGLLSPYKKKIDDHLSSEDLSVIKKIDGLLELDKIYHEATYSRSDLAQEVGVSEATISRIININYNKSFPQLLNERRIGDSKILLLDTSASIKIVSSEVGFNSLPSFNRVFKDMVGQSPSSYRKNMIK